MISPKLLPICFFIWFMLSGCLTPTQFAIRQVAPVMMENSEVLQKEKSWEFFKTSVPGSLQLAEVLLAEDPENPELLALLTKGYASYGFVINDTEALVLRLQAEEEGAVFDQALSNLDKALRFGMRYLKLSGVSFADLNQAVRSNNAQQLLRQSFDLKSARDRDAVLFTGISWLLSINYRTADMTMVSQVPHAYALIQAVCEINPNYQSGLCPTLEGIYYLSRPRMMGGDPVKGQKVLEAAMKRYPDNSLIGVTYLEWYLVPAGDQQAYQKLRPQLRAKLNKWRYQSFTPGSKQQDGVNALLNIFNAMADKRLSTIEELSKEIF